MDIIIDANPLFSALIKDSFTAKMIVNDKISLFAPEYLFDEFLEHKEEILAKTKRTEQELNDLVKNIKEIINIIPLKEFETFLEDAKRLTTDEDDTPYLALALKLKIPIWSNDKKLKKQNKVVVHSTEDLFALIRDEDTKEV